MNSEPISVICWFVLIEVGSDSCVPAVLPKVTTSPEVVVPGPKTDVLAVNAAGGAAVAPRLPHTVLGGKMPVHCAMALGTT